ncbi:MAG: hypothetical protein GY861_11250 [bacterium]|nr:hypothetical protein [bacterium]
MDYKKMLKKDLIAELEKKTPNHNIISDCHVKNKTIIWDGQALESVDKISQALLNMTELFKSQEIEISTTGINMGGECQKALVQSCSCEG